MHLPRKWIALKRPAYTLPLLEVTSQQGVGVRVGTVEALGVSLCGGASTADLGGSSNYSTEDFERRSG